MIDPVEFGKQMGAIVREAVAPLEERIAELEALLERGIDAPPTVPDIVAGLVKADALAPILDLYVAEAVAKHMQDNPLPAPEKGDKGDPGVGVNDLFRADGGHLIAVLSDGTTKDLGQYVGKNGQDGLGFDDAQLEAGDGEAIIRLSRGDAVKELRIPLPTLKHVGFWQAGMSAKASETTTHDGSLWLALRDTSETPGYKAKDWQLAARKGADGQPGKPGKDYRAPEPVSLRGDGDA